MNEEYSNRNFWRLNKPSLRYAYYAFLDTEDYLADQLFLSHKVDVKFLQEYGKENSPYVVIMCRCRKQDVEAFEAALTELPNKMLLLGFKDYLDVWKEIAGLAETLVQNGGLLDEDDGKG